MTWGSITIILLLICVSECTSQSKAPFIDLDTTHQARSQFQVNLILNQNRNHPIILVTVSNQQSKKAAQIILQNTHKAQPYSAFSILVDCGEFLWNLNHTTNVCNAYYEKKKAEGKVEPEVGTDSYFTCQLFVPSEMKIKEKGHTLIKNHEHEYINEGKYFTSEYLGEAITKNLPDFVSYIEDQYELVQFLQESSDFKVSKLPKLLYFDQNLLAPLFIRKLSALMEGKIEVGVTDDPPLAKRYSAQFDSLIFLQYSFSKKKYQHRKIEFDENSEPQKTILNDQRIKKYMRVKKNRDILLDFQHRNKTIYQFDSVAQVQYLQTHGRLILLQISNTPTSYSCPHLPTPAQKHQTLFNYICMSQKSLPDLLTTLPPALAQVPNHFLVIPSTIQQAKWIPYNASVIDHLPRNVSRQRVSSESEAEQCIKNAIVSERYPVFFYLSQKTNGENIVIMNYFNSLHEVTSLLYICQIMVPDQELVDKYKLKINSIFTVYDRQGNGQAQKFQQTNVTQFLQIKMFLRQISIQKMYKAYQSRLLHNQLEQISSNEQLNDKCFDRKCIVALIATGRYRQQQQIKILKQLKLQYEQLFRFVWIDGICHWDVPRQLKILKKKQKVIDRSYVFYYCEKDIMYSLWEGKKHWDKKELERWVKSLKNTRKITHLKFGIDIESRICKRKDKVLGAATGTAAGEEL